MVYRGEVRNGAVAVENGDSLPEGAQVEVTVVSAKEDKALLDDEGQTLGEKLLKYAGVIEHAPTDLARQHDHYIHGKQKS